MYNPHDENTSQEREYLPKFASGYCHQLAAQMNQQSIYPQGFTFAHFNYLVQ